MLQQGYEATKNQSVQSFLFFPFLSFLFSDSDLGDASDLVAGAESSPSEITSTLITEGKAASLVFLPSLSSAPS